ncbi:unnamed protein product [Meloidogyne enterolobii]|uniref:Uncharacterized protein n=1 Tax=Meloidogyne enterolobii TaxID=390850 RepID=A0ACB1ASW0_MELEN
MERGNFYFYSQGGRRREIFKGSLKSPDFRGRGLGPTLNSIYYKLYFALILLLSL